MKQSDTSHDYDSAHQAAQILNEHGFEAYIIGGAVRDLWLDRHPKDFDLVTDATPEQIIQLNEFDRSLYKDPAQAFGITRVHFTHNGKSGEIEIATFRQDIEAHLGRRATKVKFATLEDDVLRRDLTINALALNPATNQLVDYVGGIDDLDSKIVRFIGDPKARIQEDPLRIMRAVRFKNHLEFQYDQGSFEAIKRAAEQGKVADIATDRLRSELTALLIHPTRRQAMQDLDRLGILEKVLPEVTAGKGTNQPHDYHAEGDVWRHELLILDQLPDHPSKRLAWAALLHDIGKPATITHAPDRIRFDRHYTIGAEMARAILKRLNFSKKDTNDITWMIHYHMAIDDLPDMRPSNQQRMLGHPAFEDLLELHRADAAASWRPDQPHGVKPKFAQLEKLWHDYQSKPPEHQQPSLKRDLGIDGHWVIKNFGQEYNLSGQTIGKVLEELDDYYRDHADKNEQTYLSKAQNTLKQLTDKR